MNPSNAEAQDPLIGAHIDGRYTVEGVLGRGGMGVVYAGVHDELCRQVAIKVLNTAWAGEQTAVERFLREARTASSFTHGNIVDVSDLGRLPDGRPYLVMPRLHGTDLSTLLYEAGPQPAKRVAELLRGVASALDLIHARGYVHRDIKPENLMYVAREDGSETVMLLDFGIAAAVMSTERRLTGQGQVFGTPHYMAPESATGAAPDARSDVYALATVAFELITGVLPFDTDNLMQLLSMKLMNDAPTLSSVTQLEFPAQLEAVLARGLAREPLERFSSASELVNAISVATEDAPVSWRTGVLRPNMHSGSHPLGSGREPSVPAAAGGNDSERADTARAAALPGARGRGATVRQPGLAQSGPASTRAPAHDSWPAGRDSERARGPAPARDSDRAGGLEQARDSDRARGPAPARDSDRARGPAPARDSDRARGAGWPRGDDRDSRAFSSAPPQQRKPSSGPPGRSQTPGAPNSWGPHGAEGGYDEQHGRSSQRPEDRRHASDRSGAGEQPEDRQARGAPGPGDNWQNAVGREGDWRSGHPDDWQSRAGQASPADDWQGRAEDWSGSRDDWESRARRSDGWEQRAAESAAREGDWQYRVAELGEGSARPAMRRHPSQPAAHGSARPPPRGTQFDGPTEVVGGGLRVTEEVARFRRRRAQTRWGALIAFALCGLGVAFAIRRWDAEQQRTARVGQEAPSQDVRAASDARGSSSAAEPSAPSAPPRTAAGPNGRGANGSKSNPGSSSSTGTPAANGLARAEGDGRAAANSGVSSAAALSGEIDGPSAAAPNDELGGPNGAAPSVATALAAPSGEEPGAANEGASSGTPVAPPPSFGDSRPQPTAAALPSSARARGESPRSRPEPPPSARAPEPPPSTSPFVPEPSLAPPAPAPAPVVVLKEPEPPPEENETDEPAVNRARAQELTQNATGALLRGQVGRAVDLLREATRLAPDHAIAWRSLGLAYERSGNNLSALDAYQHYLSLVPTGAQSEMVRERMRALRQP
jgi:serine/threonine protein kinase